ncbi:MAG: DUF2621 family protein [Polyangiaceae bacterium]|nr:DUF2621 family protein [Polyangiaceae bacterium]
MSDLAFFGVSHVDFPTTSLPRALAFLSSMGFSQKRAGEGFIDVDAHTLSVRLVEVRKVEHPVTLRIQVSDVEAAVKKACASGATVRYEAMRTPQQEIFAQVQDRDGNSLVLWRECTEDEFDHVPELPKQMTWEPDADALLKLLLKSVPALFRALARRRVAKNAEHLAGRRNLVTREEVIRSYILSSAKITRYRNRAPLVAAGIDVSRYEADFESD